jgi:hypothetical protein
MVRIARVVAEHDPHHITQRAMAGRGDTTIMVSPFFYAPPLR